VRDQRAPAGAISPTSLAIPPDAGVRKAAVVAAEASRTSSAVIALARVDIVDARKLFIRVLARPM
jgi:hypothetical protein